MNTDKLVLMSNSGAFGEAAAGSLYGECGKTGEVAEEQVESWGQITWRRFRRNKVAFGSMLLFVGIILIAILAPVIAPFDPNQTVGAFAASPSTTYRSP